MKFSILAILSFLVVLFNFTSINCQHEDQNIYFPGGTYAGVNRSVLKSLCLKLNFCDDAKKTIVENEHKTKLPEKDYNSEDLKKILDLDGGILNIIGR